MIQDQLEETQDPRTLVQLNTVMLFRALNECGINREHLMRGVAEIMYMAIQEINDEIVKSNMVSDIVNIIAGNNLVSKH